LNLSFPVKLLISLSACYINSYLWTCDLYGPVRNGFDAVRSITRASVKAKFFGLCEMVSSRLASVIWGPKKSSINHMSKNSNDKPFMSVCYHTVVYPVTVPDLIREFAFFLPVHPLPVLISLLVESCLFPPPLLVVLQQKAFLYIPAKSNSIKKNVRGSCAGNRLN
jgi:hypothetical protein